MARELDTERLDFVDNRIYKLIRDLAPDGVTPPEWDIELIGDVADTIEAYYVKHKLCTDKEFRDYYADGEEV